MAQLSPHSEELIQQIVAEQTAADEARATHDADAEALAQATAKESDSLLASRNALVRVNDTYRQLVATSASPSRSSA
jgi:hypothetical protein